MMLTRILFATLALFIPVCAAAQQETGLPLMSRRSIA